MKKMQGKANGVAWNVDDIRLSWDFNLVYSFFEKPDLRNISAGCFLKIWDEL